MKFLMLFLLTASAAPKLPAFKHAFVGTVCAPHDALATSVRLFLSPNEASFPRLEMTYWGKNQPKREAGAYALSDKEGEGSYCPKAGACRSLESYEALVAVKKDFTGKVKYRFKLYQDSWQQGETDFRWSTRDGAMCG